MTCEPGFHELLDASGALDRQIRRSPYAGKVLDDEEARMTYRRARRVWSKEAAVRKQAIPAAQKQEEWGTVK